MLARPAYIAKTVSILAFDPGTANLGYMVLRGNPKTSEVQVTSSYGVFRTNKWVKGVEALPRDRLDILGTYIRALINVSKPDFIAMEDFVEQGKRVGKTYKEMSYLIEHLRLMCRAEGYEATIYSNGAWKKKTLGATNASKIQVQHFVRCKIKGTECLSSEPDHVWDSAGIGYCRWLDFLVELRGR